MNSICEKEEVHETGCYLILEVKKELFCNE